MRSVRKPEPEYEQQYWVCVTATSQSPEVHEVKIDLYQTASSPGAIQTLYGVALRPYPLTGGESYKWSFKPGDIVAIGVRYTLKANHFRWHVAGSSIWMTDGAFFRSGERLKDRSELFR
jgi:hypothetical protein